MDLMDVLNFANISYKSDIKVGAFLRIKGIDEYLDNDLGEYRYIYFIKENTLYISIRGSNSIENWFKNIATTSIDEGYKNILHYIMGDDVLFLDIVKKVVITGHSLGGSISIKIANYLKQINNNLEVKCIAFLPMKPYKSKFKNSADITYFTVEGDLAHLFPFTNHISGREIYFNKNGKIKNSFNKILGIIRGLFKSGYGIIESHKIEILLANLMKNETKLIELGLWEV